MYEESCSYRVNERKEEIGLPSHCVKCSTRILHFCGEKQTGYCTDTIQCNAIQCNGNSQFHYRGSAFVAYVLYGSLVKMT